MSEEIYLSVDVESAGPIPGTYSMLSFGACVVGNPKETFYAELKPISAAFVPEALEISGFDLKQLEAAGTEVTKAMKDFNAWILKVSDAKKPIFVGFNGTYDWQFINWYFISFCGSNPLGFGGIDIKSYYMGLTGLKWSQTTSSQLNPEFQPDVPQTHNALDDAVAQASMFSKMLKRNYRGCSR